MKARKKATCPVLSCSPPPLILDTDSYLHHPSPPSPHPFQVSNQETESIPVQIPMDQEQPSKVSKKRKVMQRALVTVRVEPEAGRQKGESTPVEIPLDRVPTSVVSKKRKVVQRAVVTVRVKGEGPPSDSWSWRKYGQKPIKGSPFPRGYYRCSSLKGCSAKKQVERCRTDASVLIVTYTSNHNHPGPDVLSIQSPSEISVPEMNPAAVEVAEGESSIVSFSPAGPNDSCKEDDDFFDELEELPISSSAFTGLGRSSFFDERILLPS